MRRERNMNPQKLGKLKIRLNKINKELRRRRKEGYDTFIDEIQAWQLGYYVQMFSITEETSDYMECLRLMQQVEDDIEGEEEIPIAL